MSNIEITTMARFLDVINAWEDEAQNARKKNRYLREPDWSFLHHWYRGHADETWELQPRILRKEFINNTTKVYSAHALG